MYAPENYEKLRVSRDGQTLSNFLLPTLLGKMKVENQVEQKILDFGCGTGLLAFQNLLPIAEKTNSTILGMDISDEMIQHAKENYIRDRLSFIQGDILDDEFDLGESNFDSIIAFYVLHFIQDYRMVLKKLYDLLKPGGQCGITVSTRYPLTKLISEDQEWVDYMEDFGNPDWISRNNCGENGRASIKKAAEEVGFNIVYDKLKELHFPFSSFNVYTDFRICLSPFIKTIPSELREKFHRSVKTHLCNLFGFPDTREFHEQEFMDIYEAVVIVLEKPL